MTLTEGDRSPAAWFIAQTSGVAPAVLLRTAAVKHGANLSVHGGWTAD